MAGATGDADERSAVLFDAMRAEVEQDSADAQERAVAQVAAAGDAARRESVQDVAGASLALGAGTEAEAPISDAVEQADAEVRAEQEASHGQDAAMQELERSMEEAMAAGGAAEDAAAIQAIHMQPTEIGAEVSTAPLPDTTESDAADAGIQEEVTAMQEEVATSEAAVVAAKAAAEEAIADARKDMGADEVEAEVDEELAARAATGSVDGEVIADGGPELPGAQNWQNIGALKNHLKKKGIDARIKKGLIVIGEKKDKDLVQISLNVNKKAVFGFNFKDPKAVANAAKAAAAMGITRVNLNVDIFNKLTQAEQQRVLKAYSDAGISDVRLLSGSDYKKLKKGDESVLANARPVTSESIQKVAQQRAEAAAQGPSAPSPARAEA